MKILVIGAGGAAGSRIVREAKARGHRVTSAGRGPRPAGDATDWLPLDAADGRAVARAASHQDVVISATRPRPGQELDVEPVTSGLAHGARLAGVRLLVVGGSGPLRVPGPGHTAVQDPRWVPAAHRPAAEASVHQLAVLEASPGTDWTYLAPPALFQPGERTGRYRTGIPGGGLIISSDGSSSISMEDFAIATLDEAEIPTARRAILPVGS